MKKQEFLNDVEHEVRMLKKHGTKEELSRMNLVCFNPLSSKQCVYGQMTGSCESERAEQLMNASCITTFKEEAMNISGQNFNEFKNRINGKNKGQGWNDNGMYGDYEVRDYSHISVLEGYIQMKGAKIEMIIDFLSGASNNLKL